MGRYAVITVPFTRAVYVHELRPGDVFTFPDAPATPLVVNAVSRTDVSSELALLCVSLPGTQLHLPANTPVRARRMLRTVTLPCLLCEQPKKIDLDLPQDGEPLSLVCGRHTPDSEVKP
ncbi:hypothetical protein ACFVGN_00885 [Streptomyces sp. NPDC057757]|uniref:hypothetical protein n=1 Tax=Streptomyces sp. NPDC057757 TaxID=3346241 RepID=UPI0036792FB0